MPQKIQLRLFRGGIGALLTAICVLSVAVLLPTSALASHGGADVDCQEGDNPVSKDRAQEILDQDSSDPHDLDRDDDGEACDLGSTGTSDEEESFTEESSTGDEIARTGFPAVPALLVGLLVMVGSTALWRSGGRRRS